MAVVNNFNKNQDDEDQKASNPVNVSGSSAPSAPSTANVPSSGGNYSAVTPQGSPTSSGRFTNIQNYLNANKDFNSEGGGLAGKITSNLQNQSDQLQNQINSNYGSTRQQQDQSRQQDNPDFVNNVVKNNNNSSNDISQFQSLLNANYGGPKALDTTANQSGINSLGSLTGLAQSEKTRPTLLSQLYSTPTYTSGQKNLDNLLLQSNPSQLNALNKLSALPQSLTQSLNDKATDVSNIGSQYAQEAQTAQSDARNALGGALNQFNSGVNDKAVKQSLGDYVNQVKQYNPEQLTNLGFNVQGPLYKADASHYISAADYAPSLQEQVNGDQFARLQALRGLAGNNTLTGSGSDVLSKYAGINQAGAFDPSSHVNFDQAGFDASRSAGKTAMNNSMGDALKNIYTGNNGNAFTPSGDIKSDSTNLSSTIGNVQNQISKLNDTFLQKLRNTAPAYNQAKTLDPKLLGYFDYNDYSKQLGALTDGLTKDQSSLNTLNNLMEQYGVTNPLSAPVKK